jgi:Tfp pilus assembly protein PilO
MKLNGQTWKRWIQVALGVVLLFDLLLLYAIWRAGGPGPKAMREQHKQLELQDKLLGADVRRAAAIRDRLPAVAGDCDRFFEQQFLPARGGYSAVVADLNTISEKSGLRTASVNFKQRELEKRGLTEVGITTVVEGDYSNLVRFINGIERSENFYLLDSLTLASSAGGSIKLNVQMRTYFRATS